MNYNELLILSSFLDPKYDQGPVLVKKSTMVAIPSENTERLCNLFFQDQDYRYISRKDLFRYYHRNTELFLLAILFWGFPKNRRDRCTAAFLNWRELVRFVRYLKKKRNLTLDDFTNLIPTLDRMPDLGISTFSKIFYFCKVSIDTNPCVILDSYVVKGISNLRGDEFEDIMSSVLHQRFLSYHYYPQYLAAIHQLAGNNSVDSVEYTFWLAGKKER